MRERFSLGPGRARWTASVEGVARRRDRALADPADVAIVTVAHNSAAELGRAPALGSSGRAPPPGCRWSWPTPARRTTSVAVARSLHAGAAVHGAGARTQTHGFVRGLQRRAWPHGAGRRSPVLLNPDVEVLDRLAARARPGAGAPGAGRRPERLRAPLVLRPGRRDVRTPVHPRAGLGGRSCSAAAMPPGLVPRSAGRGDRWPRGGRGQAAARGLGGGLRPGSPALANAGARSSARSRRADLPLWRGFGAGATLRRGGHRDLVLARGPCAAPRRAFEQRRLRRGAVRTVWPELATRSSGRRLGAGVALEPMISRRPPRSGCEC